MKISPRDILIIAIVGVVIVAIALVAVLIWPQTSRLRDVDARIQQAQEDISSAEALLSQRQEAKNRAAVTDAELIRLANAVPENPELPSLIIELQDTATDAGVQFRTLTPGEPEQPWQATGGLPAPQYLKVPMTMQVLGSWTDTVDYLKRLQRFPRGLRITAVNAVYVEEDNLPVGAPDPAPSTPIVTDLTIEAYVMPSDAVTSTAPADTGQ